MDRQGGDNLFNTFIIKKKLKVKNVHLSKAVKFVQMRSQIIFFMLTIILTLVNI